MSCKIYCGPSVIPVRKGNAKLLAFVHHTFMNTFGGTINLKSLYPGQ